MWYMCRIRKTVVLFSCCLVLTACGGKTSSSEVFLYQGGQKEEKENSYEEVKVKEGTYKETITGTGELYYPTENTITINDGNSYLDKICVKNYQKVNKGDVLAYYHIRSTKASLQKKKLLLEQEKSKYEVELRRKESEVLAKEKSIRSLTSQAEKKIARIELTRMKSEYKALVQSGRDVRKQEKEYKTLVRKQKRAVLKSPYSGTVVEATSVVEWDDTEVTGEKLMAIRDESDFLIEVKSDKGGYRYNMTVDISLGKTTENITHRLKGRVISTTNLVSGGDSGDDETEVTTLVKVSKEDMKKYPFKKSNIYVSGITLKIKNALMVDSRAVYEEVQGKEIKYFVYLLQDGKLHKRYIVSNYKQDEYYLINQGLEAGQVLAVIPN